MKKLPSDIANHRAKLVLDNLLLPRCIAIPSSNTKAVVLKRRGAVKSNTVTVKSFKDQWWGE